MERLKAKKHLDENKIEYKVINAEENRELARSLKIVQAPTLATVQNGEVRTVSGLSDIIKLCDEFVANETK